MSSQSITVVGAGVLGIWQALTLARAGHRVRLVERSAEPFAASASRYAGAMLSPDCEAEAAPEIVRSLGHDALRIWRATLPDLVVNGSLVVAHGRDLPELKRFARATRDFRQLGAEDIGALEPDLSGRFASGLLFENEAHMPAPDALAKLLDLVRVAGAEVVFGQDGPGDDAALVIDCRGMAARDKLANLRGVRGERLLIKSAEVHLNRPVRLLHPRYPIYVVPWGDGRFVVGATVIESEDAGPASVRSALELLGSVFALHPAFGEAEILDIGAGVRPAFPDNVPRAVIDTAQRRIFVNGAYRHGFLLAPVLAEVVRDFIATGASQHPLLIAKPARPVRAKAPEQA